MTLNDYQQRLCDENSTDFSGLRAIFVNTTLKRQRSDSHTQLLLNASGEMMAKLSSSPGASWRRARMVARPRSAATTCKTSRPAPFWARRPLPSSWRRCWA